MAIEFVGACFKSSSDFQKYLETVQFGVWRPRFITAHHTGSPDLKIWNGWQTRPKPVSDEQWLKNLASYYGSAPPQGPPGGPWSAGPQFFFTPKHFCVLTPPNKRGVHAASFNGLSWGVEMVGDFDREKLDGSLRKWYVEGLACLHIATGLKVAPYEFATQGLHFHRDDPKTTKTCPGKSITKDQLIREITAKIEEMTGGDGPAEQVASVMKSKKTISGIVNIDGLSVRAGASAKTPVLRTLKSGAKITVAGEAMNAETRWLNIAAGEWVSARFVDLQA